MSSPEQWEKADEILAAGQAHVVYAQLKRAYREYLYALARAWDAECAMRKISVGRTEAPTLVTHIAEALEELSKVALRTAQRLREETGEAAQCSRRD